MPEEEVVVPMNEAEVEVEQPTVLTQSGEQLPPEPIGEEAPAPGQELPDPELTDEEMEMIASKEDVDACIEAIRALTEVVGEVNAKVDEIKVTLAAGKF